MRKFIALMMVAVLTISAFMLCGCSLIPDAQAKGVTDFTKASFTYKPGSNTWDATDFLVGEFYVNSGDIARFDGRGTVTVIRPDGISIVGLYSMAETTGHVATVTMQLDGAENTYSYERTGNKGDFTLSSGGAMLVYSPVEYD